MKIRERVTSRGRSLLLGAALGALLLVSGCGQTNPQSVWLLHSDLVNTVTGLFIEIIIMGTAVFIVVEGALLVIALRYRAKPGDPLPPQTHGSTKLEFAWTIVPVILLLFILTPTLKVIFETQAAAPSGALQVEVVGHQFWWEFDYPASGVVTADEIHVPVGQTVNLVMTSNDVIHGFWIPAIAAQRDVNPGSTNYIWFTGDSIGEFPGQCTQLCGYSHANMHMKAFVQNPTDFQTWVQQQQQPAISPADGDAAAGAQLIGERGCAGCHTINGTAAQGKVGPNLTHFGSRTTVAGGTLDNTPDNLRTWLRNPPAVKPGSVMPNLNLSNDDLTKLTAYLEALK